MHSVISTLLFLTLALNGIACACPADSAESTHSQHNEHQADKATAENCHGDECDNGCDELTASKTQRQSAALHSTPADPELDEQAAESKSADTYWPPASALHVLLTIYKRYCAEASSDYAERSNAPLGTPPGYLSPIGDTRPALSPAIYNTVETYADETSFILVTPPFLANVGRRCRRITPAAHTVMGGKQEPGRQTN